MRTYRKILLAAGLSAAWCAAQEVSPPPETPDVPESPKAEAPTPAPARPPAVPMLAQAHTPAPAPPAPAPSPTPAAAPTPALAPVAPAPPPPPAWAKDAYSRGTYYLDQRQWNHAIQAFNEAIQRQKSRVDGAYYWKAYAMSKAGRRTEAMKQLQTLAQLYPNSTWLNDAKALELSLKQASGMPMPPPEKLAGDDLKMLALNSLMMSDPDRAVPVLEKMLNEGKSPEQIQQALFLLAQSDSPKAKELLGKLASQPNQTPERQRALAQIYMMEGNTKKLLELARSSSDPKVRGEAMQMLGMAGGTNELVQLYATEKDPGLRRQIIQGLAMAGASDKIRELAATEKDQQVRRELIQALGMSGGNGPALVSMYSTESSLENKRAVINALMMEGDAKALVDLARREKDPALKRELVTQLGMIGGKDASDYLLELIR